MSILIRNLKSGLPGFKKLVNDLESTSRDKRQKILEAIEREDPSWIERITKSMLSFNEIFFHTDTYVLQKVLDKLEGKPNDLRILVMAIKGETDINKIVLANLSTNGQKDFLEAQGSITDVTDGQKYIAQLRFVSFARKAEEETGLKIKQYAWDPAATIAKPKYEEEPESNVTNEGVIEKDKLDEDKPDFLKINFISVDPTMSTIPIRTIARVKTYTMVFDIMSFGPGGVMLTTENPLAVNIAKSDSMILYLEPRGKFSESIEVKCQIIDKKTAVNSQNNNQCVLFRLAYNDILAKNVQKQLNELFKIVYDERPQIGKAA